MDRRMEPIEVRTTNDGTIEIIQDSFGDPTEAVVIRIATDQVEILTQWLKDAKKEIQGESSTVKMVKLSGV
ncbi:MAG: hypothetical protein KF693_08140 [Nitrospira sp.]|nr:hypothetical protein [Nitrospira sp.]